MKAALTRAKVDKTLVSFLGNVANIGLLILVIIAALGKLGIPTTSVTALIGGAGLAVALSLKDQLSNFAAGALIILFRPFKSATLSASTVLKASSAKSKWCRPL